MKKELMKRAMDLIFPAKDCLHIVMDEIAEPRLETVYNAMAEAGFLLTTIHRDNPKAEKAKKHILERIVVISETALGVSAEAIDNPWEDRDQNDNLILSVPIDKMCEVNAMIAELCELIDVLNILGVE